MNVFLSSLFIICLAGISAVKAGNNTITDEVYFDIKVDDKKGNETWRGRFVVGLFGDALPMSTFNFLALAKGYRHKKEIWTYKDCLIHRIVPDFMIQSGDIINKDGTSHGRAIYSPYFIDEAYIHSHRAAGYVGYASNGYDSNASQFYIMLNKARYLDGTKVLFGKVVKGMDILKRINEIEIDEYQAPKKRIKITDSGVLPLRESYDLTEEQLQSEEDVKVGPAYPGEPVPQDQ